MESSPQPVVYNSSDNFLRKRHTATWAFVTGILLFFLPFAQLKCVSTTLGENSGFGIAVGQEWKIAGMGNTNSFLKDSGVTESSSNKNSLKLKPNIFALIALAAAAVGILFTLSDFKQRKLISMCAGIIAAVMLIGLMMQMKIVLRSTLSESKRSSGLHLDSDMSMIIKVQFTMWYYLSLASFAAAAFFSYKHYTIELHDKISQLLDFEFQERKSENP